MLETLTAPIGGIAGPRNRELTTTLRALLGTPRPTEGEQEMTSTPTSTLFGQDLGMAHRAGSRLLTAFLDREGMVFPEWVAMLNLNGQDRAVSREAFAGRLVTLLDGEPAEIEKALGTLEAQGVIAESSGRLELTESGQARFDRLFTTLRVLGDELFAGIPAEDVATTRRVLTEYAQRATESAERG